MLTAQYHNGRLAKAGDIIIEFREGFVRCVEVIDVGKGPSQWGDIRVKIREVKVLDGRISIIGDWIPVWSAVHIEDASAVFFRIGNIRQSSGLMADQLPFGEGYPVEQKENAA